jgi:hypothetical protein
VAFAEVLKQLRFRSRLRFHDNVPLAPIVCSQTTVNFDGLSRIDCVVEDTKQAAAIEVKLGTTRMGSSEFGSRFFSKCQWSDHVPARVKGNMIAVLDGRFIQPELGQAPLKVELEGRSLAVLQTWFLVLRRDVWRKWEKSTPTFQRPCYVLLFEDFVPAVGGATEFDEIVRLLVGSEFAGPWGCASSSSDRPIRHPTQVQFTGTRTAKASPKSSHRIAESRNGK